MKHSIRVVMKSGYSFSFLCDNFEAIMGSPVKIQDAEELIFVNPYTHEKNSI